MSTDVMITWILLALVAGALYTAPKYILTKAKEGFYALTGKQIEEVRSLLGTPSYGDAEETSKGVKQVPDGTPSNSTPASADTQNCQSLADGQGALLNDKKEKDHCPKPTVIYKTQAQYVPAPAKECPDLRDFIRKDQIPCWNCSLPQ
jgi:hypothetical protein